MIGPLSSQAITFTCIMCIILATTCLSDSSDFVNNTFVPTDSWQIVNDGQPIPAGLHVRINLQTGKKEAKLLDDTDKKETGAGKSALIPISKDAEEALDIEKLKEVLKDLKGDDGKSVASNDANFRSYEDIKRDLKDGNIFVKTEIEVLKGLMDDYVALANGSSFDEPETTKMLEILMSLEYLVHQYDNAVEFAKMNGFSSIVLHTLNSTYSSEEMRAKALLILGSASQSNPKVQLAAVQAGCVSYLLKFLSSERDIILRSRALYALSCLARSFPAAQSKLVQEGGISVLSDLFDDTKYSNEKIRRKIAMLLMDLIIEAKGSVNPSGSTSKAEIYEEIGLELILRDQGWCYRVTDWLCRQVQWKDVEEMGEDDVDHEVIDVAVGLMLPLSKTCLEDFVTNIELHNVVNHVKEYYNDLVLKEMDEGVNDSFYAENLKKLRALAITMARTSQYEFRDEL